MISELGRRILANVCGIEWVEDVEVTNNFDEGCSQLRICVHENPDFTTPDDWELVRKSIKAQNAKIKREYLIYLEDIDMSPLDCTLLSPKEQCEQYLDFMKAYPDLFPWVEEMEEVKE
jgi:hypothetical protein